MLVTETSRDLLVYNDIHEQLLLTVKDYSSSTPYLITIQKPLFSHYFLLQD